MRVQREGSSVVTCVCVPTALANSACFLSAAFTALGNNKETWTKRIYPDLDHTVTL